MRRRILKIENSSRAAALAVVPRQQGRSLGYECLAKALDTSSTPALLDTSYTPLVRILKRATLGLPATREADPRTLCTTLNSTCTLSLTFPVPCPVTLYTNNNLNLRLRYLTTSICRLRPTAPPAPQLSHSKVCQLGSHFAPHESCLRENSKPEAATTENRSCLEQ